MRDFILYDLRLRLIISVIYRFVLGIYGLLILVNSENIFESYIYIIEYFIFLAAFKFLFGKDGKLAKLRLLNDIAFILIILYGKELNTANNIIFLFLPIFNSPNHSGVVRSNFVVFVLSILVLFILNNFHLSLWYLLPFFALWLILLFEQIRFHLTVMTNQFMSVIDLHDVKNFQFGTTHKLYRQLIEAFNSSGLRRWFTIKQMICFVLNSKDDMILYNSSEFISSYEASLTGDEVSKLKNGLPLKNIEIELNGVKFNQTILRGVTIQESKDDNKKQRNYIFCFVIDVHNNFFYTLFNDLFQEYLKPLLLKISRIVYVETELRNIRDAEVKKIKSKLAYVNNSVLAIVSVPKLRQFENRVIYLLLNCQAR